MIDHASGSAGRLLRQAREAQGLHIAALAAAIKVAPRKLDALENDRWAELPDATFTRALAQSVCRTLGIDPRPVLELLPSAGTSLDRAGHGINTPFRSRSVRDEPGIAAAAIRPMVGAALVLMVAAVVVYFLPEGWLGSHAARGDAPAAAAAGSAPASAAETAASAPAARAAAVTLAPSTAATAVAAVAATAPGATAAAPALVASANAAAADHLLQLRTSQASWVEVRDARGQTLLSRVVQPGESLGFDAAAPLRLTIGNAAATQVVFRGSAVDLAPNARDNVARLELP